MAAKGRKEQMQRLKGVKRIDYYSASLAALGSLGAGAGSAAAQLALAASSTAPGLRARLRQAVCRGAMAGAQCQQLPRPHKPDSV